MPLIPVYRVVAPTGQTVAEYPEARPAPAPSRRRAFEHAARIGGKVFYVDEHGYLDLVFGTRDRTDTASRAT